MAMADLRALESHVKDQDRILDMDLHDASIQLDAMLQTLEETAQKSATELLPGATPHSTSTLDQSQRKPVGSLSRSFFAARPIDSRHEADKAYLYLRQEALQELQQMDKAFLEQMESYYNQIMDSILLHPPSSSTMDNIPTTFSSLSLSNRFDRLLKRNPAEDKELVRLCSIYRATKMSHIRATAQLKCLEHELDHMKALYAQQQAADAQEEAAADQDLTTEYVVSVAQSKMRIQRSKQQHELEMISVQREVSRLESEMEQVLSDPDPVPVTTPTKRGPRAEVMEDIQGLEHDGEEVAVVPRSEDERRGVLVDVCERIARTDVELRFVSATHRDYIETQKKALLALDQSLDRLLEYYCFGVLIEQVLEKERGAVKTQKDILWAAIQECQDHQKQSSKLRTELSRVETGLAWSSSSSSSAVLSRSPARDKLASSQQKESEEFLGLVKRNMEIQSQISEERWTMVHTHVGEISSVSERLSQSLLHQYSTTEQVQLVPREIHDAKRTLEERTMQLKQEYLTLNDKTEKLSRHSDFHRQ
ncbi:hypothetical protein BGZ83_002254 [Gryganskiella cystojenkinii]|nr:hypothetical protein BGZ83_002254 [Gryganskiella cystojenkinii]